MSLTSDFRDNPRKFLEEFVVVELSETQPDSSWATNPVWKFRLVQRAGTNIVEVKRHRFGAATDTIEAYYLPWQKDAAVTMDLGDTANFMFTCELTNCRFSVLADDPKKPKVAHTAGTLSSGAMRNVAEIHAKFCTKENAARARRLSISGGTSYVGQQKDMESSSSAFVFGQRDTSSGDWKFYAQVVPGVMAERYVPASGTFKPTGLLEI